MILDMVGGLVERIGGIVEQVKEFDVANRLNNFVEHIRGGEYVEAAKLAVESTTELIGGIESIRTTVNEVFAEAFETSIPFEDIIEGLGVVVEIFGDAIERAAELEPEDWAQLASIGANLVSGAVMISAGNAPGGAIMLARGLAGAAEFLAERESEPEYAEMAERMPESVVEAEMEPEFMHEDPVALQDRYFDSFD